MVHSGFLWLEEPTPITDMLIHRITWLPHSGENPAMAFGRKKSEHDLVEAMKDKFKLAKKLCGYTITSITNPVVKVVTQIFARKIMWKCPADEVPTPVVALAA